MRIECDIDGIEAQPPLLDFFEKVLRHAASKMSFDLAAVGRVIVASQDRFGHVVASIKTGTTHTNTEAGVAGGKTIPRLEGKQVVSDIVLQSSLFENFAGVVYDQQPTVTWEIDHQESLYVICHEFGHALDHSLRDDALDVPDPRSWPFTIQATSNYYGRIAVTELAACRNSALIVTEPLFNHQVQEAVNRMTASARQVMHYLDSPSIYSQNTRAHVVCQGAWLNMVELAKLYGSAFGYPARETCIFEIEDKLIAETKLGNALEKFSASYPHWDFSMLISELTPIWHRYTKLFGVRFVIKDGSEVMEEIPLGN